MFDFVRFCSIQPNSMERLSSIDFGKADTSDCKVCNCSLVLRQTLTRFRISRAEFQISMIRIPFEKLKFPGFDLKTDRIVV